MTSDKTQRHKNLIWQFWQDTENAAPAAYTNLLSAIATDDVAYFGPAPLKHYTGAAAITANYWEPLRRAFPDLKRDTFIYLGGASHGRADGNAALDSREWVSGLGSFVGTFEADWLTIPASKQTTHIRFQESFCFDENGQVSHIYLLLDIPDVMRQAGYPVLPPDNGSAAWARPAADDGVLLAAQPDAEDAASMSLIRNMIYAGLNAFDKTELKSMGMRAYFQEDLKWFGPCGIGTMDSLKEFEDLHQQPWLVAFPDRKVADIDGLIAEGRYMAAIGFGDVVAHQTGPYLDAAPSGNRIEITGTDMWNRNGDKIEENWVFVDMIDMFEQMGVDLFARMREVIETGTYTT